MLFIHGSLAMGGIETFIVRMAKQRAAENKNTTIILLSHEDKSDAALVNKARLYAKVIFLNELTYLPSVLTRYYPYHLSLLLPLKSDLTNTLKTIKSVHVSCGICAFFYFRLHSFISNDVKFTIGLYHSLEFCWGGNSDLPYYEMKNRELFFKGINNKNRIFFNESMVSFYESISSESFQDVNLFPLGVVDNSNMILPKRGCKINSHLRLVSVGRLVPFKTYNLHMLDIIKQLKDEDINVSYDIYGDGPLENDMQQKIIDYNLVDTVCLKGRLNYNDFSSIIAKYDIFIGSGTAIVEAASLGVCAIVGIENTNKADTYGFFANLPGFSYNEDGLFEKRPIIDFIMEFDFLSESERKQLSMQHINKAKLFSMKVCSSNFNEIPDLPLDKSVMLKFSKLLFRFKYSISFFYTSMKSFILRKRLSDQYRVTSK